MSEFKVTRPGEGVKNQEQRLGWSTSASSHPGLKDKRLEVELFTVNGCKSENRFE